MKRPFNLMQIVAQSSKEHCQRKKKSREELHYRWLYVMLTLAKHLLILVQASTLFLCPLSKELATWILRIQG